MGDEAGEAGGVNGRMTLEASAQIVYSECMALKKGERCLIVFDKKKKGIAQAFYDVAQTITEKVEALEIPEPKTNGQEPAKHIAEKMKDCDVLLLITSKSLSHTDARRNATKKHGVRAASMPGITEEMAWRTLAIDYKGLDEKGKKLQKLLRPGAKLHLTTPLGTDLTLTIGPEIFNDNGIYTKDGAFGNLPAGEAGFAPVEGTTSGILVINKSMAGVGKLASQAEHQGWLCHRYHRRKAGRHAQNPSQKTERQQRLQHRRICRRHQSQSQSHWPDVGR